MLTPVPKAPDETVEILPTNSPPGRKLPGGAGANRSPFLFGCSHQRLRTTLRVRPGECLLRVCSTAAPNKALAAPLLAAAAGRPLHNSRARNAQMPRPPINGNSAPLKAALLPRSVASCAARAVRRRGAAKSLRNRAQPHLLPTVLEVDMWLAAPCYGMRSCGADAARNDPARSIGPPSTTAPCAWPVVTSSMRRIDETMHSCRLPAAQRREGAELLVRVWRR